MKNLAYNAMQTARRYCSQAAPAHISPEALQQSLQQIQGTVRGGHATVKDFMVVAVTVGGGVVTMNQIMSYMFYQHMDEKVNTRFSQTDQKLESIQRNQEEAFKLFQMRMGTMEEELQLQMEKQQKALADITTQVRKRSWW